MRACMYYALVCRAVKWARSILRGTAVIHVLISVHFASSLVNSEICLSFRLVPANDVTIRDHTHTVVGLVKYMGFHLVL